MDDALVERLRRWEEAGGTWHAVGTSEVVLCRCDGGEVVERLPVDDDATRAFLRDHPRGG